MENDPCCDTRLIYHFESLLECLPEEKDDLIQLANNPAYPITRTKADLLNRLGLLTKEGRFISPLLSNYLKRFSVNCTVKEVDLTKNECRLFELLQKSAGQICPREDAIKAVWGEKGWEVNEHALDQLVHRLRDKLTNNRQYLLQTIKGRGFRLKEA